MGKLIAQVPLWQRFVFAFTVAGLIFLALVLYVNDHQQPLQEAAAASNAKQQVQTDNEAKVLLRQEQAPQVARMPAGDSAVAGASAVLTRHMKSQVAKGSITGPLDGAAKCTTAADSTSSRAVFHCNVFAGVVSDDTSLRYPFDVVVAPAARTVVYCQVVTSPTPDLKSPPVSSACR